MQLIIVDDIGRQKLCNLPDGSEIKENILSTKEERIQKMLKAQGKEVQEEFTNYIDPNHFYVSASGYEYIKCSPDEFWRLLDVCNALSMIDAGEQSFYVVNVYYTKIKNGYNSEGNTKSQEINLESFRIEDPENKLSYNSTLGELCTALARGLFSNMNELITKMV